MIWSLSDIRAGVVPANGAPNSPVPAGLPGALFPKLPNREGPVIPNPAPPLKRPPVGAPVAPAAAAGVVTDGVEVVPKPPKIEGFGGWLPPAGVVAAAPPPKMFDPVVPPPKIFPVVAGAAPNGLGCVLALVEVLLVALVAPKLKEEPNAGGFDIAIQDDYVGGLRRGTIKEGRQGLWSRASS